VDGDGDGVVGVADGVARGGADVAGDLVIDGLDSIVELVVGEGSGSPALNAAATVPMQQQANNAGVANRSSTFGNGSLSRPGRVGSFTAAIMYGNPGY